MIKILPVNKFYKVEDLARWYNRYSEDGAGKWKEIQIVSKPPFDLWLITHEPKFNKDNAESYELAENVDYSKAIVCYQEPYLYRSRWFRWWNEALKNKGQYFYFFENFMLPLWCIDNGFTWQIENEKTIIEAKEKQLSLLLSKKKEVLPGYADRLALKEKLINNNWCDYWGKNDKPIEPKDAGLMPYKYHLSHENSYEAGYITEKLYDAIIYLSLPFYNGAPDVGNYIDINSIIYLDAPYIYANPQVMDKIYKIICDLIEKNEWQNRLELLRKTRIRVLTNLNPLNIINNIAVNRRDLFYYE